MRRIGSATAPLTTPPRRAVLGAVFLALLLAACSRGGDSSPDVSGPGTVTASEDAIDKVVIGVPGGQATPRPHAEGGGGVSPLGKTLTPEDIQAHRRGHPNCVQRIRAQGGCLTGCLNCFESNRPAACCPTSHPFYCNGTDLCYRTFEDAYFSGHRCVLPAARACGQVGGVTCRTGQFACRTGCCRNGSSCCSDGCCGRGFPLTCPGSRFCFRTVARAQRECGNNYEICGAPVAAAREPATPTLAGALIATARRLGAMPASRTDTTPWPFDRGYQPLFLNPDWLREGVVVGPLYRWRDEGCGDPPDEAIVAGRGPVTGRTG